MNPPPGERRTVKRREADEEPTADEVAQGWVTWVIVLAKNRARLVAVASFLTFLATTLGWRLVGPTQDLADVKRTLRTNDSVVNRRVDVAIENQRIMQQGLDTLRIELRFQNYLLCTNLKRTDPAAVPPECGGYTVTRSHP